MKQSLPIYGVLTAVVAIAGLGFLASQLIFSDEGSQQVSPSQSGKNVEAHMEQKPTGLPKTVSAGTAPQTADTQTSGLAVPAAESPVGKKSTMVPGSALKNKELKQMTGAYGYKLPEIVKPPVAAQKKVTEPADKQGWFSKLLYGDKAKMAAEQQARKDAARAKAEKERAAATSQILDAVLQGTHRKNYKKARDKYRHPKETLMFLGLHPDMTVIEMWPGEGWYSEIIAPVLKGKGLFYAASWDRQLKTRNIDAALKRYTENYVSKPEIFGKVILTSLSERRFEIGPANSADLIFSSRNMYSWMRKKMATQTFQAMFWALKPGGILGIVDHRQDAGTYQDPRAISGYVTEDHVIRVAKQAGFVLVSRSDINANPKDTKKYPRGVFSLPPVLKEGKRNRKKYKAIGESDRMTLKFMKPGTAVQEELQKQP